MPFVYLGLTRDAGTSKRPATPTTFRSFTLLSMRRNRPGLIASSPSAWSRKTCRSRRKR